MKKIPIILMSLLLSASVLTSCAKPIIDSATDASKNETIVDTSNGNSGGSENNGGENNNGTEDNNGENNNGEVAPPNLDEPDGASVYSGTPDTSWYDASDVQSEYIITTADQLMGLNQLRKDSDGAINFDGVTIKLGADIIINEGTLANIKANGADNETIVVTGSDAPFKGTFDGQGHSISGVYLSTEYSYRSIFGTVGGSAQIKNFVLENSYFSISNKPYFGAIVGRINDASANVSLTNITLADTVLLEEGSSGIKNVGGFVRALNAGKLTVNNCHFNGTVNFPNGEHIAGFVGQASGGTTIVFNNCHGTGKVVAKDYVTGLSVYTDTTTKSNNGSCLTGSISCTTGSNQNASYIK